MGAEDNLQLMVSVIVAVVVITLIFFALRAICLVGSLACCVCECCECITRCCRKCARCFTPGSSSDSDERLKGPPAPDPLHRMGNWSALLFMITAILVSIIWQFYGAKATSKWGPVEDAWEQHCDKDDKQYPTCAEYSATLRVSFATVIVFFLMAVHTFYSPFTHDRGWDIKVCTWIVIVFAFMFVRNGVFDDHGYVWVARIGAFIFIILQQVILIDCAYTVNEYLSGLGEQMQQATGTKDLNRYFVAVLLLAGLGYAAAFVGIVLMYVYYSGCSNSEAFISISFVVIIVFTALQLLSDPAQGHNILVSSAVAAYVVYLTYVAVSANPIEHCNPTYSDKSNSVAVVIGLGIAFLSLCGTVLFSSGSMAELLDPYQKGDVVRPSLTMAQVLTSDVKTSDVPAAQARDVESRGNAQLPEGDGGRAWKFNIIMMLIAMYYAMVLTNWGNPQTGGTKSSPTTGKVTSWINISASWVCLFVYTWTLIAPKLFPDRDFTPATR